MTARFAIVLCSTLVLTLGLAMGTEPPGANSSAGGAMGFLLFWTGLLLAFLAMGYQAGRESR